MSRDEAMNDSQAIRRFEPHRQASETFARDIRNAAR
jgi:hypothetical protein